MNKRASTSLLFVTGRLVARADFGPAPARAPLSFRQAASPPGTTLRESVAAALGLGPRCARDVWLLTDQLWTQRLYFAAPVMDGLNDEQLRRAIGFEVESFSGTSAVESRLGIHRLGVVQGAETFWITQVQDGVANEINDFLFARGGHLRGLAHPGGLPVPLACEGKAGPFSRVEIWSRATICMEKAEDQAAQVRVVNVGPSQPQWRESIASWLTRVTAPNVEWLVAAEPGEMPEGVGRGKDFAFAGAHTVKDVPTLTNERLADFLGLWARELSAPVPRVPIIAPPPEPARVGRLAATAVVLLALVLAGSAVRHHLLSRQLDDTRGRLAVLNRSSQQPAGLARQIDRARKELQQLESAPAEPAGAAQWAAEIRREQNRWPALLAAIADNAGDAVVVDTLSGEPGGGIRIEGASLRPAAADKFAANLSLALSAGSWAVGAAEKWTATEEAESDLWQYRILVLPQARAAAFEPAKTDSHAAVKSAATVPSATRPHVAHGEP
jgi:Tfp pilus assembly protein PilN